MADKKITELTQLTTLSSDDLFVVVDDPTGTPITKKIAASDIFGNGISYVTTSTYPAAVVLRSVLTANVNANTATANTLVAAEFITNATATSANSEYQYAVRAYSKLSAAAAKVGKEHAVAKFVLDVSNATSVIGNTYVSVLSIANTGARVSNVQAFIGFGDTLAAGANSTCSTLYLFDIGLDGVANVSQSTAGANVTTLLSNTSNGGTVAATHKVRVKINGTDYWLLAANSSASNI
jgi:hypothetical protein